VEQTQTWSTIEFNGKRKQGGQEPPFAADRLIVPVFNRLTFSFSHAVPKQKEEPCVSQP
jgi:hypothetical protein